MDLVQSLAPIVSRACRLEDVDEEDVGRFVRILCLSAGLDDGLIQLLFEHIITDLVDTQLLESCEFHSALDNVLSPESLTEILIGAYGSGPEIQLADVVVKLSGGDVYKPSKEDWKLLRQNMSATDFRHMVARLIQETCEKAHHVSEFLTRVYDQTEEYELAETMRIILEGNWVLDILPQKRKAARKTLHIYFGKPFPSMKKILSDFCRDMLQLSPLPASDEVDSNPSLSSSSDSDIESQGSLADFIADSDVESGTDSDSSSDSEESASSEEHTTVRKRGRRSRSSSPSSIISSDTGSFTRRAKRGRSSK
jgi:hypothetical protein